MPENFPELTIQANSPRSNYEMMSQNNSKIIAYYGKGKGSTDALYYYLKP